jgi:hypothetical protein
VFALNPPRGVIGWERKSGSCYVLWTLTDEGWYDEWVANLSLDFNWTLTPVRGPCYDDVTTPNDGGEPLAWQQRQRRKSANQTTT